MNIFKRYLAPLLYSTGFAALALLAGCGGGDQGRDPILGLPAATLSSLAVTPATASVAAGLSQQFAATATYTDGSTRDVTSASAWTSATPASATVNAASGLATGVAAGSSVIGASYNGIAASATLTVTPAVLVSLGIAPQNQSIAIGGTRQYIAVGTFSDHSVRDVTSISTFASASPLVATIAAGGLATGKSAGTSAITAISGKLSAGSMLTVTPSTLVSIALTPQAPIVQALATRQLAVIATYSDNSTADVTAASTFVSATPAAATVNTAGMVQGIAAGGSIVTASFQGMSATTTVTVPAATVASLAVTPATASVAIAGQQQFIATATYSDNSKAVVTGSAAWTTSSSATGTVLASGIATGVAAGTTNISATLGGKSASATLTVTAAATVPPPPATGLNMGSAANFAVLAGTSLTNNSGGTTLISGNVGSPSQTTDPTLAAGYTNYKSGAILANGLADLQVAITDGNSRTCDVIFVADVDLGGQTLAPGVYCSIGAVNITGTLALNGPGLYIFRTALTLNTTANSIVALTNGATAANVYWLPVGPTTLGANSVFKGSILGQAAAITVGDNTTLINGRVLTAAAVTLRNNQIAK